VIAIAVLAGLRSTRSGRIVLFALPLVWLIGSATGPLLTPQITLPVAETVVNIVLGALLAPDRPLPVAIVACLGTCSGCSMVFLTAPNSQRRMRLVRSTPPELRPLSLPWCRFWQGRAPRPCPMGACSCLRRRELDRGHRSFDAWLCDACSRLVSTTNELKPVIEVITDYKWERW
jgi:hypothetical protein